MTSDINFEQLLAINAAARRFINSVSLNPHTWELIQANYRCEWLALVRAAATAKPLGISAMALAQFNEQRDAAVKRTATDG
jgi:hypothetical protein